MKIIYSHLKTFLPDLNVEPQKLRDDLTMIGHFCNFYEEVEEEIVFDLDIKVNRGDCLGYYGMARDLAVYYNLKLVTPLFNLEKVNFTLNIEVKTDNVTRVMAVKISDLKNFLSPEWLSRFVKIHGTNSINILVDLTNYIMFMYGIPNHAFDTNKSTDHLIWEMNPNYSEFISLDNSKLVLNKDILMINNPKKALSLSFWGGESCAIDMKTTETIIELAIYNPTLVRKNSHQLKASTEAATRLEKFLDPSLIPIAFNHLVNLITEMTGGKISSSIFDYYPNPAISPVIKFDFELPTKLSGIPISKNFCISVFEQLGCEINGTYITPPSIRVDITQEEDLVEEVVRFNGYYKIPITEVLPYKKVPDITPKEIYLIDQIKDRLVSEGYDEVLTWPIISQPLDQNTVITIQNSINTESIYLRQSLIPSLQDQLLQYQKFKLPDPKFFEIGKIFSQKNGQFIEKNALCTFDGHKFEETILDDLPKTENYIPNQTINHAIELTSQIITLDANVTINEHGEPVELIEKYSTLIDKNILWSMEITDIFENKYTFRVNYYNCDDKTAKKIHLSTFDLTTEKYNYIDPKTPTILQYYSDMYQVELEATIINIKSNSLILDKTIFFPEGGGQPSDIGTINGINVTKLQYKDEQVLHEVENNKFSVGDKVKLKIDWNSRYKYMKIHSAGHLLHEVLTEIYPSILPIKGYHHDESYLTYRGQINSSDISKIETFFNQKINDDLPIICDYTDIETLKQDARSIPKNLPLHKKLRRLKIGNYPSMADGGIQVESTKEIGNVIITKVENNGEQSTIYYQLI